MTKTQKPPKQKRNIIDLVKVLNLPQNQYVVVGGSLLVVLGLLEWDDDIDIAVSPEVFRYLKKQGWRQAKWHGKELLRKDVYEVGVSFGQWSLKQLLSDAHWLDGVPFISLDKLKQWKTEVGREKDLRHVRLIEQYQSEKH